MLVSKVFIRRPTITSTWTGLGCFLRTLSNKHPRNDQDSDILKSNPYFDKYADKIREMKATFPDELNKRLSTLLQKNKVKDKKPLQTQTKTRKLSDIMYVELLEDKPASEMRAIWENYQHGEYKFATSITLEVYEKLEARGKLLPTFLYPLPRITGFEYILSQFSGQEVHFSPLINYQMFKENAPECLALTHFTDIADSTKIVFVLGEFNKDVLDVTEAICLYHQLQRYYGEDNPRRLKMIEQFNHSPHDFLHMDLIAELESLR